MGQEEHFKHYSDISEATIGFVQWARMEGLSIGIKETQEALLAGAYGSITSTSTFKYALKSIFCNSPEERALFDKLYEHYWGRRKMRIKSRTTVKNASNIQKKSPASLVWMGMGEGENGKKESARRVSGANQVERLRKTDFGKLTEIESEELEKIAMELWRQMSLRLKRKMKTSPKGGRIDLRNTIRANVSRGGELLELKKKKRTPRKQRIIVLLDVSGSMDTYSFFLLRFIYALRIHFESIEAFIFSTKLIRITDYLDSKNLEATLAFLSLKADNWSSGTKIGECLHTFNEEYAKAVNEWLQ